LDNLAQLYQEQGCYNEAESLYQESLQIRRNILGEQDLDVAISFNNLALLYYDQGRYTEAVVLLEQALKVSEEVLGSKHSYTLTIHNHLDKVRESLQ
jgi:tetratricopeptide (TPR) repeat protein